MTRKDAKRHGVYEIEKGRYKGSVHIPTDKYYKFIGELYYLSDYLHRRVNPIEDEEVEVRNIILNLQNIIEQEVEEVLYIYLGKNLNAENRRFLNRLRNGYVSFKGKMDCLLENRIISRDSWDKFEQLRILRNYFIHRKPTNQRIKIKYFNQTLMRLRTIRQIFKHFENERKELIKITGNKKDKWPIIPPGYAKELKWEE